MNILVISLLTIWFAGCFLCVLIREQVKDGAREASDDKLKKYGLEYDSDDAAIFEIFNSAPWFFILLAFVPILNYLFAFYLAITHPKKAKK